MSLSASHNVPSPRRKWFGLLRRKESWSLTWRGWLALLLVLIGGGIFVVRSVHDFLAVHSPVETRVLVLEGWVPRYALTGYVAQVFGDYDKIYTTGGPTLADRNSRNDSDTYASVAQSRLVRVGVPAAMIQYVPGWEVRRDRTFASALSLRKWGETNGVKFTAFNLVTLGPHARRSRLLYEKAFPEAKVGIIPLTNEEYDADHWWRYSEGVKETMSETLAYLYSRFLFSPE
jgi:hypothetical protein